MRGFEGDLLIGGMVLRHLHGELQEESPDSRPDNWQLSGCLHVAAEEQRLLELNRQYRLELEDGRAAAVVISRMEPEASDSVLAQFAPAASRPK